MKRYAVAGGLFLMMLITYIDRAAISSAALAISADLKFSNQAMGGVFSAFALGYAIAQVPGGWLADRYGPRLALALVVAVWSLFTGATGAVQGLTALLAIRFLFGVAEAGAFPGAARVVFNWLPVAERGRANGIIFSGSRLGAAFAFPVMALLLDARDWRTAFYLLAVPGLVWSLAWALLFRNYPAGTAPAPEVSRGSAGSFARVVRSRAMLLAMIQYFAGNFTFFICLTWMLPYLRQTYGLPQAQAARYAMLPLLIGALAHFLAGILIDIVFRSRYIAWSRRLPGALGFLIAAIGIGSLAFARSAEMAIVCFTLGAFGAEMTIAPSWAYCMDIGGENSGAVSGSMNMIGNFGSFVSANAFPFLQGLTGTAAAYFGVAAALNVAAVLCWLRMRSVGQPQKETVKT